MYKPGLQLIIKCGLLVVDRSYKGQIAQESEC